MRTPVEPEDAASMLQFSHANGTIKAEVREVGRSAEGAGGEAGCCEEVGS